MKWILGLLGFASFAGLIAVFLAHPPATSADWAGWVQAGGSILAIVASVGVVGWQAQLDRKRARQDRLEEQTRHLEAAHEIIGGLAQVAGRIATSEFTYAPRVFDAMRSDLGPLAEALGALDHTRLRGRRTTQSVLVALGASRQLLADVEGARVDGFNQGVAMSFLSQCAEEMREILNQQEAALAAELREMDRGF